MNREDREFDFKENLMSFGVKRTQKTFRMVLGAWHGTGKKFVTGEVRIKRSEGFKWVFKNFEVYVKLNDLLAGKILYGTQAYVYIKEHIGNIDGLQNMTKFVFFFPCVLCLVFSNIQEALVFEKFLQKSIEQGVRISVTEGTPRNKKISSAKHMGEIFDIMKIDGESDLWAEFQVTLIDDDNSYSEKLLFDKSQSNLKKSVNESKNLLRDRVNSVNFRILESFFVDVSRIEYLNRFSKLDSIKKITKISSRLDPDRNENSKLRAKFLELNKKNIEKDSNWFMRKVNEIAAFDELGSIYCILNLQKLKICMDMCELASQFKDLGPRRSLDSMIDTVDFGRNKSNNISRGSVSKSPMRRVRKAESPSKRIPGKKSFFREACDCTIY